jgi:para-aminobenzoate synthetase component 1
MRKSVNITVNDKDIKSRLLAWAQQYREIVFLDSNYYNQKYSSFDAVLAVDAFTSVKTDYHNAFEDLNTYQQITGDWIFGYLSYELKNDTEKLTSGNFDGLEFPDLYFFQPKKLFLLKNNNLEILYLSVCEDEMDYDLNEIINYKTEENNDTTVGDITIKQRISRPDYLDKAGQMLSHIYRGDIYEANFCMEFYAENTAINTLHVYNDLNKISEPPFAAYFKNYNHYLMCASPERYIRKEGGKIISQPIKGTARRSKDETEDSIIKDALQHNEKERSENIMIVDLVRNDLSRTAAKATVDVEELCEAYTFKQVHHLISTVVSQIAEGHTPVDVIKAAFPMGSMTGAPKISAMHIIEKLEETKRGLYSGAIGYFTPQGDFDFNVVIRSILYNSDKKYLSFSVGSAITAKASPEQEYDECLLKAAAMFKVLSGNGNLQ